MTPGGRFRAALAQEQPLQIAGTINAYCALLAAQAGFQALYLSGAGVANASLGQPDLAVTTLADVVVDARRITARCDLPLLVDIDTAWDDPSATVAAMIAAGVAAVHVEDQVAEKRCGHRPNKTLVTTAQMCERIRAAVAGKAADPDFVVMARTDAVANEGLAAAIARAQAYVDSGAEMIFAEALTTIEDYQTFSAALSVPVLANMTEFGRSPLLTTQQLATAGVAMVLYPLSAFRSMAQAAETVYRSIRSEGSQVEVVDTMQHRDTLYRYLDYHAAEAKQDGRG